MPNTCLPKHVCDFLAVGCIGCQSSRNQDGLAESIGRRHCFLRFIFLHFRLRTLCRTSFSASLGKPVVHCSCLHHAPAALYCRNVKRFFALFTPVCFRCRGVVQVALAAMEAHQRTSALAGSGWQETVAAERAQLQQLRFDEPRWG